MADNQLVIGIESDSAATIVTPEGDVDLSKSSDLRTALQPIIDAKPHKIIVDLHAVPYMDSSGVATLIEALQLSKRAEIHFTLCCLSEGVQTIINLARLDKIFTICDSREDAIVT